MLCDVKISYIVLETDMRRNFHSRKKQIHLTILYCCHWLYHLYCIFQFKRDSGDRKYWKKNLNTEILYWTSVLYDFFVNICFYKYAIKDI